MQPNVYLFSVFFPVYSSRLQYEEVSKNQSFAITQSLFGLNDSSQFALRDFSHINDGKDPADISGNYLQRSSFMIYAIDIYNDSVI